MLYLLSVCLHISLVNSFETTAALFIKVFVVILETLNLASNYSSTYWKACSAEKDLKENVLEARVESKYMKSALHCSTLRKVLAKMNP